MSAAARLWVVLWTLGHAARARADTSIKSPPFALATVAAAGGWMAAAVIQNQDGSHGEDVVRVARSKDGGRSWEELPSPRRMATWECCSENAGRGIVGLKLKVRADGAVEVGGTDDYCRMGEDLWRYRWSGGKWREIK